MRIGLLGGSFNPAHGGHRAITLKAMAALGLDEVWWLVSPGNPLKPRAGMAPLAARFASAQRQARRAPIRVTALEQELGTRFTVDTARAIVRRWPKHRFIWLMGADNLAQFDRWKAWRRIAATMPIAVIARPGYDRAAFASPAMAWLRRYRLSAASFRHVPPRFMGCDGRIVSRRAEWSAPALVILNFDPDSRSASAIRAGNPDWAAAAYSCQSRRTLRDGVTHSLITNPT